MFKKENGKLLLAKTTKYNEEIELYLYPKEGEQKDALNQIVLFCSNPNEPPYSINFMFQNNNKWFRIGYLDVPESSRKGYGKALIEELLKIAKENNIQKITGELSYKNQEHRANQILFYKKMGFVIYEPQDIIEMDLQY